MNMTWLKTMTRTTLAISLLAIFAQSPVFAQDTANEDKSDEQTQADASARRANARKLEGVWDIQVTGRNCQTGEAIRTFPAMHTYMRGGTMSDFGTGRPPSTRSPGMGVWSYQYGRRYTTAFQFFLYNADGTLAGRQIGRAQIQVSHDGNSYTTTGTGQILDVNGNVIANTCSTSTGTRFE